MWRPHGNRVLETRFIRGVFNEIKHQQFKPREITNTSKVLRILWKHKRTHNPIQPDHATTGPPHETQAAKLPRSAARPKSARDPGPCATQVRARPRSARDLPDHRARPRSTAWRRFARDPGRSRAWAATWPLWSEANLWSSFFFFFFLGSSFSLMFSLGSSLSLM